MPLRFQFLLIALVISSGAMFFNIILKSGKDIEGCQNRQVVALWHSTEPGRANAVAEAQKSPECLRMEATSRALGAALR